jgi:serine/threonine protein kinase
MGCVQSTDNKENKYSSSGSCCQQEQNQETHISSVYNDCENSINSVEIDLSHFQRPKEVLGIGGFGLVRKVLKTTGSDRGSTYALKSINKGMILSRQSGITAVMTELKTLILVDDCDFICRLHYAFQDDSQLYMIMDYALGGDLRYNLRKSPNYKFSERLSKVFIIQALIALDFCHSRNILHRGNSFFV